MIVFIYFIILHVHYIKYVIVIYFVYIILYCINLVFISHDFSNPTLAFNPILLHFHHLIVLCIDLKLSVC